MAKTKEELNVLKNEYKILTTKLQELSEDELGYVVGGIEMEPTIGLDFGLDNLESCKDHDGQE